MNRQFDPAGENSKAILPYGFARKNQALLIDVNGAMVCRHQQDCPLSALAEVQRIAGSLINFEQVLPEQFDEALNELYRDNVTNAAQEAASADNDLASLAETAASVDDLLDQRDDAPVVRLINAMLLEAIKEKASDIHIEIEERRLAVRFRTDGVLREVLQPSRSLAPLLVSRIKVMGKLDIAEKRLPQDGRVSLRVGGYELDVRVSTIPSQYGERVVLRLLERGQTRLGLQHLGMSTDDLCVFENILQRPNGLLLVTGPTGSGKTTSLYAALDALNDRSRNIMTVEDPIEYSLDGVGQMQVNAKTELTFARGLRAILRQDPDVIMVGEIRDRETAQTAVESAMTGHLVLSTLHTNSAIGAISRLVDMGVERYLLAPMLRGLVAQRLVRKICQHCREPRPATVSDCQALGNLLKPGDIHYTGRGCSECFDQGFSGRLALYEVIKIDARLEHLIHNGAPEAELIAAARQASPSLIADGVRQMLAGQTSLEEVLRVVHDDTSPASPPLESLA